MYFTVTVRLSVCHLPVIDSFLVFNLLPYLLYIHIPLSSICQTSFCFLSLSFLIISVFCLLCSPSICCLCSICLSSICCFIFYLSVFYRPVFYLFLCVNSYFKYQSSIFPSSKCVPYHLLSKCTFNVHLYLYVF